MSKQLSKNKVFSFHLLVFILTGFLFFIINFLSGKGFFCEYSVLKGDSITEYINFLAYLQNILKGDFRDLFYTFSLMPGGGTALIWGWHLISPFNVILIFFQKSQLLTAYYVIEMLKVASCGLTMSIFLKKQCVSKSTELSRADMLKIIVFSLSYAFCGFITAHTHDIMWLDGILILPLIAYSLCMLINNNNSIPYFICLLYSIITNFYIGFMMCIFSTLCFAYICLKKRLFNMRIITQFIITSILAAGASAIALFPIMYQVQLSKMSDKNDKLFSINHFAHELIALVAIMVLSYAIIHFLCGSKTIRRFPILIQKTISILTISFVAILLKKWIDRLAWTGDFLQKTYCLPLKMLIGTYSFEESQTSDLMNVYMGLFLAISFVIYLFDYRTDKLEKILNIETLILCICMMGFMHINYVWHGFTHPLGNFYRWSFMFSFFIIYVTAKYILSTHERTEALAIKQALHHQGSFCLLFSLFVILVFAIYYYTKNHYVFLSKTILLINLSFLAVYLVLSFVKPQAKISSMLISFVIVAELTVNGILSMNGWEYLSKAEYESYIDTSSAIMQTISSDNSEEYRTECSYHPMYYYISDYNSVFHHSSAYIRDNLDFMALFGMNGSEMMGGQRCENKFDLDPDLVSFWGIKYLISEEKLPFKQYAFVEQCSDDYSGQNYYLYKNNNALPLVFTVDKEYNQWDSYSRLELDMLKNISKSYNSESGDTGLQATGVSQYHCKINVPDSKIVMFSFPYDKGWRVLVDGKEITPTKAFGYFLSIPANAGMHDVTIQYVPPYLREGIVTSIISLILFALLSFFLWKKPYLQTI